jgi:5'-3' exonuclease
VSPPKSEGSIFPRTPSERKRETPLENWYPVKVHLVDGTYELFRSYYGAPPGKTAKGVEVGASRSLLRGFIALAESPDVTHLAVAYDHVIESFRNQLFAGYKTGEGIDPDLYSQFALAERVTLALGIVTWPMIEFEADDAIGTAASSLEKHSSVEQVVICSPDKDFAQCVRGSRIVCWDRMRDTLLDEPGVSQKFGIGPHSIPDWLALVGDSADGIPGVPRWGKKSAATILARYEKLEHIPSSVRDWDVSLRGAEALSASLEAHRAEVELYRTLATLRTDAPIDTALDTLCWRGASRELLGTLCEELEDDAPLTRVRRFRD